MIHYLVVAHQTATSPELMRCVSRLAAEEPRTTFTILVPATPVDHLLTWEEGETLSIARRKAEDAKALFEERGLTVVDIIVGDASPIMAIGDELRSRPYQYDGIVLSTLPPGVSRWLRLDVNTQAQRKFGLPVIQVVTERSEKVGA